MRVLLHCWHGATVGDTVLAEFTARWLRDHYGAEVSFSTPKTKPESVWVYDVILLGPCGVIYDPGPPGPKDLYTDYTDYMTSWLFEASKAGKPIIGFNVGVQMLHRRDKAEKWAEALNLCQLIITREKHSKELLKRIGVATPIEVCADLGFCIPSFRLDLREDRKDPYLGVNLLNYTHRWRDAITVLRARMRLKLLIFSPLEGALARWMDLPYDTWPNYTYDTLPGVYRGLDYAVTQHIHAGIFSVMGDIPFLAWDQGQVPMSSEGLPMVSPKYRWLLEELDWPWTWRSEDSADRLVNHVQDLANHREKAEKKMERLRAELRPKAERSFQLLTEILKV